MSLETQKFVRKPFYIDAIEVTAENMEEVAAWCQGDIRSTEDSKYIQVRVHRPMNERQTRAFVGDRVLYAGSGYKVYSPKAFDNSFELVKEESDVPSRPVDALAPSPGL